MYRALVKFGFKDEVSGLGLHVETQRAMHV